MRKIFASVTSRIIGGMVYILFTSIVTIGVIIMIPISYVATLLDDTLDTNKNIKAILNAIEVAACSCKTLSDKVFKV